MIHVIFTLPTTDKNGNPCDISRERVCAELCFLFNEGGGDGSYTRFQFRAAMPVHRAGYIEKAVSLIKDTCYVDQVLAKVYMPDDETVWL